MLTIQNLTRQFPDGDTMITVLDLPAFEAPTGSQWCLTGVSGSGKSTLLQCIAGLLQPTTGTIQADDVNLIEISSKELDHWRGQQVGYIFQDFNLLSFFNSRRKYYKRCLLCQSFYAQRDDGRSSKAHGYHGPYQSPPQKADPIE